MVTSIGRAIAIRKSVLSFALLGSSLSARDGSAGSCRAASFPKKTRATFTWRLQLPDAASLDRTDEAARKIEELLSKIPGVKYTTTVVGFSLLSIVQDTYSAFFFVTLKPWEERTKPEEQYEAIKMRMNKELAGLTDGIAFAFPPPAIPGVGTSGGFTFLLQDRAGKDIGFLAREFGQVHGRRAQTSGTRRHYSRRFCPTCRKLFVDVDRDKVLKQGIDIGEVYQTLQTFMGGYFVNYFNRFGRTMADLHRGGRRLPDDPKNVGQFYVRNSNNDPVPLDALATIKNINGPEFTLRFNEYRVRANQSASPRRAIARRKR